jgi:hypothetical protein
MEKLGDIEFQVGLEELGKESEITPINSKGNLFLFFWGGGRTFGEP